MPHAPHFVRDYRALAAELLAKHSRAHAMALTVGGGDYDAIGVWLADLLIKAGVTAGASLIDIGCGSGRLPAALAKRFGDAISYLGIDVVPELLDYARQQCAASYEFKLTDGTVIPAPPACADFVSAFSVVTHLRRRETAQYFSEASRVLRRNGRFVFSFLELPYHSGLFFLEMLMRLRRARYPEVHFLPRRVIGTLAERNGFLVERFLPDRRSGVLWSQTIDHSLAVLRRI